MIPKECKRLAEVDFPIAEVSKHSATDKYLRHKPNTTIHMWWAQRPLASCRAVLLALLLPDPVDPLCPKAFIEEARRLLPEIHGTVSHSNGALRISLLKLVAAFADPELSVNPVYLRIVRELIGAAREGNSPLVVDPFAGAGSIPFEAIRMGCDAFASDLNPVAVLLLKLILEDIPGRSDKIRERTSEAGARFSKQLHTELGSFYPNNEGKARPAAFIWARTVRCESPNCGAEIPLLPSLWLCKKVERRRAFKAEIVKTPGKTPHVEFRIFEPTQERDVSKGTTTRAKAICSCCGSVLLPDRVRSQLKTQRGGTDPVFDSAGMRIGGARLLAVVSVVPGTTDRQYRMPMTKDYEACFKAQQKLLSLRAQSSKTGLSIVPNEPLPFMSGTFNVPLYGIDEWGKLFSSRQLLALITLSSLIRAESKSSEDDVVSKLLYCVFAKFARHCNGNARWNNVVESVEPAFGTQSLSMTWCFPESVPWGPWAENFDGSLDAVLKTLERAFPRIVHRGQAELADAQDSPLPDESCDVWFTDPPYYFAVPYADLSDFFYVWLKRTLPHLGVVGDPFDSANELTPKNRELCEMAHWDSERYPNKNKKFFESGMSGAFHEGRRLLKEEGIGCVVFAHKTTEGWEALLSGMINSKWVVTASWPITTERAGRLRARDSAALAASVHLVCRPRSENAEVGDWGDVLKELPKRVGAWMERLQSEGIRGADLVFACIGPALEIFSRYSRVESADGKEVKLDAYLEKVWEVVGRIALENVLGTDEAQARNGMAGVLEEDARLTALFLWTLQSTEADVTANDDDADDGEFEEDGDEEEGAAKAKTTGFSLVFDVARRFAQPLGIHLDNWEGRIIETKKGVVRLFSVTERAQSLFGDAGASAVAYELETNPAKAAQFELSLGIAEAAPKIKSQGRRKGAAMNVTDADFSTQQVATTLDRVHAAMLLQKAGRSNALRALLKAEQHRSPDFLRLANALSALYPKTSEEKRLLDAMLLAVPR
jgi:putative DNA methylase